jgi:YegS/Rv2252/BmrU family lipid kinase
MALTKPLCVMCNPSAAGGRGLAQLSEAEAQLTDIGCQYRVVYTESLDHAETQARVAARAHEAVVAVGGDGLIGRLAGALQGQSSPLAIVPAGRGNDFARVMGIPTSARAAIRMAVEGQEHTIDIGEVNGQAFVGIASVGFDSLANSIANEMHVFSGRAVYLVAALRALWRWRQATFEVSYGTHTHTLTGYSVAVANSKAYGGGMLLAPYAELDDGKFDVLMVGHKTKPRFLQTMPKVFRGAHLTDPAVSLLRTDEVRIAADRSFTVYADGEPLANLPVTVRTKPAALRVIAGPIA